MDVQQGVLFDSDTAHTPQCVPTGIFPNEAQF